MGKLVAVPIERPGVRGVDTQNSQGVLHPEWATIAEDFVINRKGRLSSRPGLEMLGTPSNTGGGDEGGDKAFVYSNPTDGTIVSLINTTSHKVMEHSPGSGTWTTYTLPTSTQVEAVMSRFNGKSLILRCATAAAANSLLQVQSTPGNNYANVVASSGTVPQYAAHMLCAWGRVWTVGTNNILQYSDLLDETAWGAGSTNQIDLHKVWPQGEDEPEALAEFNGFLVIFGKKSIIVYEKPDQVSAGNMAKVEAFTGVGCLNFQTIAQVGDDLVFLAKQGVVSFSRLVQEKSMPVRTLSDKVRNDIITVYEAGYGEVSTTAAYSEQLDLYVLETGTSTGSVWFFDTTQVMEDGTWRVTQIDKDKDNPDGYTSPWEVCGGVFPDPVNGGILVTSVPSVDTVGGAGSYVRMCLRMRSGVVRDWIGTEDDTTYPGVDIPAPTYATGWMDLAEFGLSENEKVSKKLRLTLENCNSIDITLQWFYNYDESTSFTATQTAADADIQTLDFNLTGSGSKVKIKVTLSTAGANGDSAITRMTYYAKIGKQIV